MDFDEIGFLIFRIFGGLLFCVISPMAVGYLIREGLIEPFKKWRATKSDNDKLNVSFQWTVYGLFILLYIGAACYFIKDLLSVAESLCG